MGTKDNEIEDLLGDSKKTKAEKPAKAKAPKAEKPVKAEEKPAKKAAPKAEKPAKEAPWEKGGKKAAKTEEKPAKAKRERPAMSFEDGERDTIQKKVVKAMAKVDKKGINSRELAEKCGTETRKLRAVLYSMERAGEVKLKPGESRVAGMTVCPA